MVTKLQEDYGKLVEDYGKLVGQQTASTSLPYSLSLHRAHPPRHRHPPHLVVAEFGHQNALETMSPLAFTATL